MKIKADLLFFVQVVSALKYKNIQLEGGIDKKRVAYKKLLIVFNRHK